MLVAAVFRRPAHCLNETLANRNSGDPDLPQCAGKRGPECARASVLAHNATEASLRSGQVYYYVLGQNLRPRWKSQGSLGYLRGIHGFESSYCRLDLDR